MVRLTDRPDMTLDVYRGRKTTIQQQQHEHSSSKWALLFKKRFASGRNSFESFKNRLPLRREAKEGKIVNLLHLKAALPFSLLPPFSLGHLQKEEVEGQTA